MHLLRAQVGTIEHGAEPVDLAQDPADIVVLTAADTEIAGLARAQAELEGASASRVPSLRVASLLQLGHNFSVDHFVDRTLSGARLIVLRLLGGRSYWPYGTDEVTALARGARIGLAVMPGGTEPDPSLDGLSTLSPDAVRRLWAYLAEGGPANCRGFLRYAAHLLGADETPPAPEPLPKAGLYWPGLDRAALSEILSRSPADAPRAPVVFYRALLQASDTAPVDAMIEALQARGLAPVPLHVSSLKDPVAADFVERILADAEPAVVLNATAFAVSEPGTWHGTPLDRTGAPVLQIVLAGASESAWEASSRGLAPRDLAMHVALPELDGRVLTRAVSFKAERRFDAAVQAPVIGHAPRADRVAFAADLAAGWAGLRRTPAAERRVAIVLPDYPDGGGRVGSAVGLDAPASAAVILREMAAAGYTVSPADADAVMAGLLAAMAQGEIWSLAAYRAAYAGLPAALRKAVEERWGAPEDDPACRGGVMLPVLRLANVALAVQPGRSRGLDAKALYHDPELPPPHGYIAFYLWLREAFRAHAVVHLGKHGSLEWLPGKALALSACCWPEALLGPLPHIYPFIANDPGEGAQAKRRSAAVIVDHLTPPLTRAGATGMPETTDRLHASSCALEGLVDEYYEASGADARRTRLLARRILDLAAETGVARDCGISAEDGENAALAKLDAFLCEIKELQIRDGLHVFGRSPEGALRTDLLVSLLRRPRGPRAGDASLLRALAADLGLDFDPLDCDLGRPWQGPRPAVLQELAPSAWRSAGDTVERLEALAQRLVAGERAPAPEWTSTRAVLDDVAAHLGPMLDSCGPKELAGLLTALDGRFIPPGPSGAPTRGRIDVLPTGRNFHSVDTRAVPTEAAWSLGQASAERLVLQYRQDHGAWPKRIALSAWGTANMRTGGDDVAQALALIGVRPVWDAASRRVTGFEILTLAELKRPRVDIVFRISGFFRDAFPTQIDLLDSAVRAVAARDEPDEANPVRERLRAEDAGGADETRLFSIFGAEPGAYGAGLKRLVEQGAWDNRSDLAEAYLDGGSHAFGAGRDQAARARFAELLASVDAVAHNQDSREFDLLDTGDMFEFEGGLACAVEHLSGTPPAVYHNDHSGVRPVIRRLEHELALIVRGRAANPKWISGMRRHGYRGAAELAATVSALLGFSATTGLVSDSHFEALFEAYLVDPEIRGFLADKNPAALRDIAARFAEAIRRGLWRPRRNSAGPFLDELLERAP